MLTNELGEAVERVIRLHRSSGPQGHTTGGMAICEHCSHGPGIGDEAGDGYVYWPCPTLRTLAGIETPAVSIASREFAAWSARLVEKYKGK